MPSIRFQVTSTDITVRHFLPPLKCKKGNVRNTDNIGDGSKRCTLCVRRGCNYSMSSQLRTEMYDPLRDKGLIQNSTCLTSPHTPQLTMTGLRHIIYHSPYTGTIALEASECRRKPQLHYPSKYTP